MNARSPLNPQAHGLTELKAWLDSLGWGGSSLSFLAGDASFRTYYRVKLGDQYRVLMVAPPGLEKPQEYMDVTFLLEKHGLSVPKIYHASVGEGLLLLEDFGNQVYSRCLQEGENEIELYEKAVDTLVHLQSQEIDPSSLHVYDEDKFLEEALVFLEWTFPQIIGSQATSQIEQSYLEVWSQAYSQLPTVPRGVVLKDYMVDNLVWLQGRSGIQACGLLDFQDAVWGDTSYDLVSLLEDARRDVSQDLAEAMLSRYFQAFPQIQRDSFDHSYYTWGAQRSTKILGVFSRLAQRDQKEQYLQHLPRVWKILKRDFQHPALAQVKGWFDEHKVWGNL